MFDSVIYHEKYKRHLLCYAKAGIAGPETCVAAVAAAAPRAGTYIGPEGK